MKGKDTGFVIAMVLSVFIVPPFLVLRILEFNKKVQSTQESNIIAYPLPPSDPPEVVEAQEFIKEAEKITSEKKEEKVDLICGTPSLPFSFDEWLLFHRERMSETEIEESREVYSILKDHFFFRGQTIYVVVKLNGTVLVIAGPSNTNVATEYLLDPVDVNSNIVSPKSLNWVYWNDEEFSWKSNKE